MSVENAKSRKGIQQEYRRRRDADFEKRQNYLKKERSKYRQDLASGKRKRVTDMHEREATKQRQWVEKKTTTEQTGTTSSNRHVYSTTQSKWNWWPQTGTWSLWNICNQTVQ